MPRTSGAVLETAAPIIIPSIPKSDSRPPLKWAGGKRWLVPYLRPLWEKHRHRRLVEPFAGGLAVTLGLRPQSALLNDINPHLINLYQQLRKGFRIEMPLRNSERAY
jgi:DNA adenine methylase